MAAGIRQSSSSSAHSVVARGARGARVSQRPFGDLLAPPHGESVSTLSGHGAHGHGKRDGLWLVVGGSNRLRCRSGSPVLSARVRTGASKDCVESRVTSKLEVPTQS